MATTGRSQSRKTGSSSWFPAIFHAFPRLSREWDWLWNCQRKNWGPHGVPVVRWAALPAMYVLAQILHIFMCLDYGYLLRYVSCFCSLGCLPLRVSFVYSRLWSWWNLIYISLGCLCFSYCFLIPSCAESQNPWVLVHFALGILFNWGQGTACLHRLSFTDEVFASKQTWPLHINISVCFLVY